MGEIKFGTPPGLASVVDPLPLRSAMALPVRHRVGIEWWGRGGGGRRHDSGGAEPAGEPGVALSDENREFDSGWCGRVDRARWADADRARWADAGTAVNGTGSGPPDLEVGTLVRIEEADYCYGIGPLILRLTVKPNHEAIRGGLEWVELTGVEIRGSSGREAGERTVLARVAGVRVGRRRGQRQAP